MIIVNFATQPYERGQHRLAQSVRAYKNVMYNRYDQIGSPTHQQSPYEFKVYAIEKARQQDPVVLWMDASMWLAGDMSKIENAIKEDGYFMEESGHYVGRWTNQHTRNYFNLTEEEAKQGPGGLTTFSAGLLGLDFTKAIANEFFDLWKASAKAGCFSGSWQDHRHDMTCGSIIAQRLGMKYQRGGSHLSYIGPGYSAPEPGSVIYLQGL